MQWEKCRCVWDDPTSGRWGLQGESEREAVQGREQEEEEEKEEQRQGRALWSFPSATRHHHHDGHDPLSHPNQQR